MIIEDNNIKFCDSLGFGGNIQRRGSRICVYSKKISPHLETASFGAGSAYGTVICSSWIPLTLPLLIHSISAHIFWCVTKARYHFLCLLVAKLLYQSKIKIIFNVCCNFFFLIIPYLIDASRYCTQ